MTFWGKVCILSLYIPSYVNKTCFQGWRKCLCFAVTSVLSDSATLCIVACQAPLSMGFFRQEYWSGSPCPPPGDLPNPGIEPMSLTSPALASGFFTTSATWETQRCLVICKYYAIKKKLLVCLFLAALGLHCYAQAFSSCS